MEYIIDSITSASGINATEPSASEKQITAVDDTLLFDFSETLPDVYSRDDAQSILQNKIDVCLAWNGCKPADTALGLNYHRTNVTNKDGIQTEKYEQIFGSNYILVKIPDCSIGEALLDTICGLQNEITIEEYDNFNNLIKSTQYNEDGSCDVVCYDKKGNPTQSAHIEQMKFNSGSYSQTIELVSYNNNGSYTVTTTTYTLNSDCENGIPEVTYGYNCYNQNGDYDILSTATLTLLCAAININIDKE